MNRAIKYKRTYNTCAILLPTNLSVIIQQSWISLSSISFRFYQLHPIIQLHYNYLSRCKILKKLQDRLWIFNKIHANSPEDLYDLVESFRVCGRLCRVSHLDKRQWTDSLSVGSNAPMVEQYICKHDCAMLLSKLDNKNSLEIEKSNIKLKLTLCRKYDYNFSIMISVHS